MSNVYFVKSTEEDFYTKTLDGHKKVNFQSIGNMIKTHTIKPNTKSFGKKRRLSTTIIHKNYLKTYRPQGLIFQTDAKPDYMLPFDLVLLSDVTDMIVHYYRIKNKLYEYYGHKLIPGFGLFVFKNFDVMMKKFPSPKKAWKATNEFRISNGYERLPKQKYRLVEYNEVIFHQPIKVTPVAVFGYRKEAKEIANQYRLPHFISARKFYQKVASNKR